MMFIKTGIDHLSYFHLHLKNILFILPLPSLANNDKRFKQIARSFVL